MSPNQIQYLRNIEIFYSKTRINLPEYTNWHYIVVFFSFYKFDLKFSNDQVIAPFLSDKTLLSLKLIPINFYCYKKYFIY